METYKNRWKKAQEVLYIVAEWLRQVWLNLYAFFPKKMWEIFEKLGLKDYVKKLEDWKLEELRNINNEVFNIKEKWENLFNRFEIN